MKRIKLIPFLGVMFLFTVNNGCITECSDVDPFVFLEFRPSSIAAPGFRPGCPFNPSKPADEFLPYTANINNLDFPHAEIVVDWGCSDIDCGFNGRVQKEYHSNDFFSTMAGNSIIIEEKMNVFNPIHFTWSYRSKCQFDRCDDCNTNGQSEHFFLDFWEGNSLFANITAVSPNTALIEFLPVPRVLVCDC